MGPIKISQALARAHLAQEVPSAPGQPWKPLFRAPLVSHVAHRASVPQTLSAQLATTVWQGLKATTLSSTGCSQACPIPALLARTAGQACAPGSWCGMLTRAPLALAPRAQPVAKAQLTLVDWVPALPARSARHPAILVSRAHLGTSALVEATLLLSSVLGARSTCTLGSKTAQPARLGEFAP